MIGTDQIELGHVYIVSRVDLKLCYIGQSIKPTRRFDHLKPGSYQHQALCVDDIEPDVSILEDDVVRGKALDDTEREWMRAFVNAGWTLVNKLGPDVYWPKSRSEVSSLGGFKGGEKGARTIHARRASDEEFDQYWRKHAASAGGQASARRRREDPELDLRLRSSASRGSVTQNKIRRVCIDCGIETTPGPMGKHLSASGHSGCETIATSTQKEG